MSPRSLLLTAAVAIAPAMAAIPASLACPADVPLSCHNTTAYDNTCCFNAPGGQVLLTQFWDTKPATGPSNSWTVHGLWPDNCDGSYEQYCDKNREYSNISTILRSAAPSTLQYMETYWKDYQGDDESFWEHEFNKHGTCISTLEPTCYTSYRSGDEVVDYFNRAVDLFKALPSYDWLAEAGIVPSTTATYTLAAIQAALKKHHGYNVIVNCKNKEMNEIWYHYNVRGSVQSGTFVPAATVGSPSTCPATGIKYLPKSGTSPQPTTTATTITTSTRRCGGSHTSTTDSGTVPTGAPVQLSGKGRLYVQTPATSDAGFLISGGKWYRGGGTPATYTAAPNTDGTTFSLSTSKGKCAVQSDSSLNCAASVSNASPFGYDGTYLTYDGSSTFYAAKIPTGTEQGTVFTNSQSVSFQVTWTAS